MAIKDLAFIKLVGSVLKKTKDKVVGTKTENIDSNEESIKETFKAAISKNEVDIEKELNNKNSDSKDQPQATKKVIKDDDSSKKQILKEESVSKTQKEDKSSQKVQKKGRVTTQDKKTSSKTTAKKVTSTKEKDSKSKKTKKDNVKNTDTKSKSEKSKVASLKNSKKEEVKKTTPAKKIVTKKSMAKESAKKATTAKKSTAKVTTSKTATAATGTKREEKIKLYAKDIKKHYGSVDDAFLAVIVKNLGPSIYRKDAELVGCSDPKELETVRRNFLIKKLGFDKSENKMLDSEIQKVCEKLKGVRSKYRATFYYILAKNLKKESALS